MATNEPSSEPPNEAPEQPQNTTPPPDLPLTSPSSKFNLNNKWLIIGGAGGGVVLLVIIVAVVFTQFAGGGPPMPNSMLHLVPEDADGLRSMDIPATMGDTDFHEYGFPGGTLAAYVSLDWEEGMSVGDTEIDLEQIDEYLTVVGDSEVNLLKGQFQFDDIREDLDDAGYEEDIYRGYEVWTGRQNYALLEATGYIIFSPNQDAVEDVLKTLYRGDGSLADAEDNELKRILDKAGDGLAVVASVAEDECPVKRCQGFGAAFTEVDLDAEAVVTKVVVLFSSERAAEDAADDYDDVADFLDGRLNIDIADTKSDGEFVTGQGTQ